MRYTTMHVAVCFAIICLPLVAAQGLIGGWVDVSIYHPDIQWAARFADAALGPFTRIVAKLRAQQQVVAGMNYRFWALVRQFGFPFLKHCRITVYRDLAGSKRLTEFICP